AVAVLEALQTCYAFCSDMPSALRRDSSRTMAQPATPAPMMMISVISYPFFPSLFVQGPVVGAADCLFPAAKLLGALPGGDVGPEGAVHRPVLGHVGGGVPVADRQPG